MENKEKEFVKNGRHNHTPPENYVPPTEPAVQEHLKWFMGLKLGLMVHWAPSSQLGVEMSWPLSDEDGAWSQTDVDWTDIETFKEQYINSNLTFNPLRFRPDRLAVFAKECGFKYLCFTTKHHDGFCMFDTDTTDYKITDPSCPFHTSPYANITKSLYEEFRKQGLAISVYFSKPDWHNDDYWHREFGTAPTRNVNYSVEEHPELWENFVQYTHRQIEELCTDYGKVDCLWLDGGWVNDEHMGQDIRLGEIVDKIRSTSQPHLVVCDRIVGGPYENILTPEGVFPDKPLFVPWEANTPLGTIYAYRYEEEYKSGHQLVHLLLDVVSKGGNLSLNLSPQPNGELPAQGVASLTTLGRWMHIHGNSIYETEIVAPYAENNIRYTKKENQCYAFYLYEASARLPVTVHLTLPGEFSSVTLMRTEQSIPFKRQGNKLLLDTSNAEITGAFIADCFILTKQS